MVSLLDTAIKDGVDRAFTKALAPDGWLRLRIRRHVRWILQGFAPGYDLAQREAFTATVADRIQDRARRRLTVLGIRLWRVRYPREWCEAEAEEMVTRWLDDERIKFGDPRFFWECGHEIADSEMDYWEGGE